MKLVAIATLRPAESSRVMLLRSESASRGAERSGWGKVVGLMAVLLATLAALAETDRRLSATAARFASVHRVLSTKLVSGCEGSGRFILWLLVFVGDVLLNMRGGDRHFKAATVGLEISGQSHPSFGFSRN